jgi:uncharacterized protein (TIGR03435 family)
MSVQTNRGLFIARGATLNFLIQYAYRVKPNEISGGPKWIDSEKYEIEGRTNADENKDNDEKILLMVQAALADRFKLKWRRETKELPIFELVVGKNGPKLKPAKDPSNSGSRGGGLATPTNLRSFRSTGATMASLASQLSRIVGRTVIDRTGLDGRFDLTLEWSGDSQALGPGAAASDPTGPSLFTAVQEQLGLRLESTKGPVQIFVIDSAEKPSEN